jgi:nitrite reductase/ring-hydroxylating ferredoxin subunit
MFFRLTPDAEDPISPSDVLEIMNGKGEVVLVRGLLRGFGWHDSYLAVIHDELNRVARFPSDIPMERVNEFVNVPELMVAAEEIRFRLEPRPSDIVRALLNRVGGNVRRGYAETTPNVRFHVPYAAQLEFSAQLEEYARHRHYGKFSAHGPHRDSWVGCPLNGLNLWIALGRVSRRNGLLIYPQLWGQPVPCGKRGYLDQNLALGVPIRCDLEEGDALLFAGENLHSSVLNTTSVTRAAVSFRFTLGRPKRTLHEYERLLPGGIGSRVLQSSSARRVHRRLIQLACRLRRTKEAHSGRPIPLGFTTPEACPRDAVRPLSERECVAHLSDGRRIAFERHCPHEGADLAFGTLEGDAIVCPWHGATFELDPESEQGAAPCCGLRALKVRRL